MNQSFNHQRKRWLLLATALFIGVASVLGFWFTRGASRNTLAGRPVPTPDFDGAPAPAPSTTSGATTARPDDVLLTLTPDKLANAHLQTELVSADRRPPSCRGQILWQHFRVGMDRHAREIQQTILNQQAAAM